MNSDTNNSPATNGTTSADPAKNLNRLSSFKSPRDLTLGGSKPAKKVFTPNLNVVRNKNKAPTLNLRDAKKDNSNHRNRDRNQPRAKNASNKYIHGAGVFSEGIAATERHSSRSSYSNRDAADTAAVLTKPTIRVKHVWKIDKEFEEAQIKKIVDDGHFETDDAESQVELRDAPIKLPICEGGTLYQMGISKQPVAKLKQEDVVVKTEPGEDGLILPCIEEKKAPPDVKLDSYDSGDIVGLLKSDKPKLMLLQLPDNLPGRGTDGGDVKPNINKDKEVEVDNIKGDETKCKLLDLEEGLIGKIQIHKSGKVKMLLGDTAFDLSMGTQPCFRQDVMSVAVDAENRTGTMINLGGIEKKLTVIPDWEKLFNGIVI